jgi:hypothetical protein
MAGKFLDDGSACPYHDECQMNVQDISTQRGNEAAGILYATYE